MTRGFGLKTEKPLPLVKIIALINVFTYLLIPLPI